MSNRKAGWDSIRNVEILGRGSVLLYLNSEELPEKVMGLHPIKLYTALLNYSGLDIQVDSWESFRNGDHKATMKVLNLDTEKMNHDVYLTVADGLLQYTKNVLSAEATCQYILEAAIKYSGGRLQRIPKRVLYLSYFYEGMEWGDAMSEMILIGFKSILGGKNVIDYPRHSPVYKMASHFNTTAYKSHKKTLYGGGFIYGAVLDGDQLDGTTDREEAVVIKNLQHHYYDMIIIPHRELYAELKLFDHVCGHYEPWEVLMVNGADQPTSGKNFRSYSPCVGHIFTREGVNEGSLASNSVRKGSSDDLSKALSTDADNPVISQSVSEPPSHEDKCLLSTIYVSSPIEDVWLDNIDSMTLKMIEGRTYDAEKKDERLAKWSLGCELIRSQSKQVDLWLNYWKFCDQKIVPVVDRERLLTYSFLPEDIRGLLQRGEEAKYILSHFQHWRECPAQPKMYVRILIYSFIAIPNYDHDHS
jgi:hypothetical protein